MLTNYADVARHVGLDPYVMLGRSGLHPSGLRDSENWLPGNRVLDLLRDSAIRAQRDDFGVLLGECRTFASLGPVSVLLRHEGTLRDIIFKAIKYRRLINELVSCDLRENGRSAVLEWNLVSGLGSTQGINLLATIAYRVLVFGAGVSWQPECIHFRHSSPRHVRTFKRVFCCALEFDSNFDGMSLSRACLDSPNDFADPELVVHAERLLSLLPAIRQEDSMTERTQAAIPFLLANGQAAAEDVANCLGVPLRTLQRKLTSEGSSYRRLLADARRELAVRYLGNSNQSITAVAHSTGFSALSSFTRWFIGEFGMSPGRWRRLMRRRNSLHIPSALADSADRSLAPAD